MKIRIINVLIGIFSLGIFVISFLNETGIRQTLFCLISGVIFLWVLLSLFKTEDTPPNLQTIEKPKYDGQITELALLNDEDKPIAFWGMYGKSSLVLGIDIGENNVDINLLNSTYSSTIDVEHALLNYSGENWYIEDLGSQNGTSIQKSDGKKYKLTVYKPCLLEKGDIICISLTKLKLC